MKKLDTILIILAFIPSLILSQNGDKLTSAVYYLSSYIASEEFSELNTKVNSIELIDSIYVRAIKYYKVDTSEALLALTFATLSFREMHLSVAFGAKLTLSLPSTDEDLFKKKVINLPSRFLTDSPKGENSDKDKIAHFFGNAFLSYNINFFHLSDFLGMFVESFENSFGVSKIDQRDLTVNKLGSAFGKALNENPDLMPSQFLLLYNLFQLGLRF